MTEYFVVQILGGIEPALIGPFATAKQRNAKARALRRADRDLKNGLFMLTVSAHTGEPTVEAYIEDGAGEPQINVTVSTYAG